VALLMLLFCLLLPIMTMMYFDILKIQKQAERDQARIEKVLKSLEEKDKK
jgi:preprotein translocase subunit YajC